VEGEFPSEDHAGDHVRESWSRTIDKMPVRKFPCLVQEICLRQLEELAFWFVGLRRVNLVAFIEELLVVSLEVMLEVELVLGILIGSCGDTTPKMQNYKEQPTQPHASANPRTQNSVLLVRSVCSLWLTWQVRRHAHLRARSLLFLGQSFATMS